MIIYDLYILCPPLHAMRSVFLVLTCIMYLVHEQCKGVSYTSHPNTGFLRCSTPPKKIQAENKKESQLRLGQELNVMALI